MGKIVRQFRCELLTPEGSVASFEAVGASFPASDGLVGVLGGRAPLAAAMGAGQLTIEEKSGTKHEYYVAGGFARMADDVLTVMAEQCLPLDELNAESIWDEIQQAEDLPFETDAENDRREEALYAARTKFRIVQEYKNKRRKRMTRD